MRLSFLKYLCSLLISVALVALVIILCRAQLQPSKKEGEDRSSAKRGGERDRW